MMPRYHIHEKTICLGDCNKPSDIEQFSSVLQFLRNFGHIATKLKFIGTHFHTEEIKVINQYIEKYCVQSLIELDVEHAGAHLLIATKASFPKMRKLKISNLMGLNDLKIHKIYPAIAQLSLSMDFSVVLSYEFSDEYPRFIRNVIKSLPKLRALSMDEFQTIEFLEFIRDHLPQLESLEIFLFPDDVLLNDQGQSVHFGSVKRFTVRGSVDNDNFPISFECLDEFQTWASQYDEVPMKIIEENIHLKLLSFPFMNEIADILRILTDIRHTHRSIEGLIVRWSKNMNSIDILRLMHEFDELKNITLVIWDVKESRNNRDALVEIIPEGWVIVDEQDEGDFGNNVYSITVAKTEIDQKYYIC